MFYDIAAMGLQSNLTAETEPIIQVSPEKLKGLK